MCFFLNRNNVIGGKYKLLLIGVNYSKAPSIWRLQVLEVATDLHRNVWFFKNRKNFVPCFFARFLPFGYVHFLRLPTVRRGKPSSATAASAMTVIMYIWPAPFDSRTVLDIRTSARRHCAPQVGLICPTPCSSTPEKSTFRERQAAY